MYSPSKSPTSPKGFPEANFSFAETSFEKVYERLQKDIKIVESQAENEFIGSTSSIETIFPATGGNKEHFNGTRNHVQLIRESDGSFRTVTGEKVVLLDHLGQKVQLVPVNCDPSSSTNDLEAYPSKPISVSFISFCIIMKKLLSLTCFLDFRVTTINQMIIILLNLAKSRREADALMGQFMIFQMKFH